MVKIVSVEGGSYAHKKGIKASDDLISINGNCINDVLDYRFYLTEDKLDIVLSRNDVEYSVTINKGEYEDIGLDFETPLMDQKHSCKNKCIFCFVDQLPCGMRQSLYFKDDDSRLSFLHGNYITLTNMTESDIDRIIKMHISPINVSVHTTNPELRVQMMKNKNAGKVLSYIDKLSEAGIKLHAQIVLCKDVNDGKELIKTLADMERYYPALESLSVVPSGLTKFRDGLYPLSQFTKEDASAIIDLVEGKAQECFEKYGTRVFWCADEFYLRAERELPSDDYYEDYSQIENGVGMLRSFICEFDSELDFLYEYNVSEAKRTVSIATGVASYPYIYTLVSKLRTVFPQIECNVYKIINNFFGQSITVSGLLTGVDIYDQLKDRSIGDELLIPINTLKADEDIFLCNMTLSELESKLGVKIIPVENDGVSLLRAVLGV